MSVATHVRVQAAPGVRRCCDDAGRLAALAHRPIEVRALLGLALARGEGPREQLEQRIADMLAGGLLIEVD